MEKNGFAITPESGNNNGEITIVASPNGNTDKEEILNVSGGSITKTITLKQKASKDFTLTIESRTDNLFQLMVSLNSDNPSVSTLAPNKMTVSFMSPASSDSNEEIIDTFSKRAKSKNPNYVVHMRYKAANANKIVLNISFFKIPDNPNFIDIVMGNISDFNSLRLTIVDTTADRNKRMIIYNRLLEDLLGGLINWKPITPHNIYILDGIITTDDKNQLKAKSISEKVNIYVEF